MFSSQRCIVIMFLILLAVLFLFALAGMWYLVSRFHKFQVIKRVAERSRVLSWIFAVIPVAAIACFAFIGITALVVIILHLVLIWLLCDLAAYIIKKVRGKQFKYNYQGIAAIVITAVYLSIGWYFAHHVYQTNYTFYTDKDIGGDSIRVVAIADSHIGMTLDGEDFAEQMERVQQTNPDVVVIVGDFVDDDTETDDMIEACRALGGLDTKYGVYFVYGNHDNGYYRYRNFTSQELRTALTENNVTILEDESVLIDGRFYLIGRKDRSIPGRSAAADLTDKLDSSKYRIMLDHQPNDYAGEESANVDLVLSGHTHGGHIFPAGLIGLAMGANDKVYGTEQRGNTTFVVTSGISGWGIPFKTGAISEYVVIDILPGE